MRPVRAAVAALGLLLALPPLAGAQVGRLAAAPSGLRVLGPAPLPALAPGLGAPSLSVLAAPSVPLSAPLAAAPAAPAAAPLPAAPAVLARAAAAGVAPAALAGAVSGAHDLAAVAGNLARLGVLTPDEASLSHPDSPERLSSLARALWRETASGAELESGVDRRWAVPALKAEGDGVTYLVHPVAHGQLRPDGSLAVRRLARQVRASGGALYSEQNLPRAYGFAAGRELLDHAAASGAPADLREVTAARAWAGRLDRVLNDALAVALAGAAAWVAWLNPANPAAWALLAAALTGLWLYARALKPLLRRRVLALAAALDAAGDSDGAAALRADASTFYKASVDPAALRRLRLPLPLGLGADALTRRSLAMADAVAADAAARGARVVHVLAGYEHALEVAWRLAARGGLR